MKKVLIECHISFPVAKLLDAIERTGAEHVSLTFEQPKHRITQQLLLSPPPPQKKEKKKPQHAVLVYVKSGYHMKLDVDASLNKLGITREKLEAMHAKRGSPEHIVKASLAAQTRVRARKRKGKEA